MRVLLIEDDEQVARSIELMLKAAGFNIFTTDLGEDGVDLGKVYEYDLIILDLGLPDISGYEVLKQLRMSRVNTPVLILSALGQVDDRVKGLQAVRVDQPDLGVTMTVFEAGFVLRDLQGRCSVRHPQEPGKVGLILSTLDD